MARGDGTIEPLTTATMASRADLESGLLPQPVEQDKVLPLPGWLVKVYFIFPIILYMPDVIFNYYVYSHGITTKETNIVVQIAFIGLWSFLSVGVVGMAYLLSVLAPWHWGQGHHIQAFFCGLGVLIATGITTWNSLAYRSQEQSTFAVFKTDDWANSIWPQLAASHISLTLILVAVAPPFWGLFWAMVQPTQSGRSLRQIQESHAQRLLRMQQQSELKRLRAETNAKIREAQLRGMAQTAAAARDQAKTLLSQNRGNEQTAEGKTSAKDGAKAPTGETLAEVAGAKADDPLRMPPFVPTRSTRDLAGARGGPEMMNHAAAATPATHAAPADGQRTPAAQPALFQSDTRGHSGVPGSDVAPLPFRRPPTLGGFAPSPSMPDEMSDADAMTGTTGPRRSVHRTHELGSLNQQLNRPPAIEQAIQEAMREWDPTGTKKIPAKELVARVAEKLSMDETQARAAIRRAQEAKRNGR